jgi:nucleotide-binding universal stress UspA family protein
VRSVTSFPANSSEHLDEERRNMIRQHSIEQHIQSKPASTTQVSFAKILVATDFSETSDRALEYALSLARAYTSKVFLTHVIPVNLLLDPELAAASRDEMHVAARVEMDRIEASGRFFGIAHEEIVEDGTLWPSIEDLIRRNGIDLVVVGTHGKSGARKPIVGSNAEEIFRHVAVPVLTVGPGVEREPLYGVELKNILLATEFGVGAERQAAYAFALAQEQCSRITLLHVAERDDDADKIVRQLKRLVPSGVDLHCLPLFRIEKGNAVHEILRAANETHADLIVLGAKARDPLAVKPPRTKAYQVVCAASCPVLTIKF